MKILRADANLGWTASFCADVGGVCVSQDHALVPQKPSPVEERDEMPVVMNL